MFDINTASDILQLVLDRTGESNVRRCTDHQSRASKADLELPALPNLEVFSFAGE